MHIRLVFTLSLVLAAGSASAQQINRITGRFGESNRVEDATVLSDNGLALAGEVLYFSPFTVAATLSRTATDGAPLWTLSMDVVTGFDSGFGVRQLPDDSLLFAFHTGSSPRSLAVARVSGAGVPIYVKSYAGANGSGAGALELDTTINGEFAVLANRFNIPSGTGGQLLRIDAYFGNVVTNRSYIPDGVLVSSAHFNDLDFVPSSNGDYFVTGAVTRLIAPDRYDTDILVARIQRFSGAIIWCNAYSLPFTDEATRYEEGYGIEFVSPQTLSVVGRSENPFEEFGPSGALHLRIHPASGELLDQTFMPDVVPAYASLEPLASGNLLACGSRTFGDGDSFAQMWEINPVTATVVWRAEYTDRRTYGTDCVPHASIDGNFLVLTGSNVPFSIPPIGSPDQMFIQTDGTGEDGCSSTIRVPERLEPEIITAPVTLAVALDPDTASLQTENFLSTLDTAIVCRAGRCVGDLNDDGVVDDADFVIFAAAYDILDCEDPAMPSGCPADLNGDGFVDDADFVIFVAAYNELLCP